MLNAHTTRSEYIVLLCKGSSTGSEQLDKRVHKEDVRNS